MFAFKSPSARQLAPCERECRSLPSCDFFVGFPTPIDFFFSPSKRIVSKSFQILVNFKRSGLPEWPPPLTGRATQTNKLGKTLLTTKVGPTAVNTISPPPTRLAVAGMARCGRCALRPPPRHVVLARLARQRLRPATSPLFRFWVISRIDVPSTTESFGAFSYGAITMIPFIDLELRTRRTTAPSLSSTLAGQTGVPGNLSSRHARYSRQTPPGRFSGSPHEGFPPKCPRDVEHSPAAIRRPVSGTTCRITCRTTVCTVPRARIGALGGSFSSSGSVNGEQRRGPREARVQKKAKGAARPRGAAVVAATAFGRQQARFAGRAVWSRPPGPGRPTDTGWRRRPPRNNKTSGRATLSRSSAQSSPGCTARAWSTPRGGGRGRGPRSFHIHSRGAAQLSKLQPGKMAQTKKLPTITGLHWRGLHYADGLSVGSDCGVAKSTHEGKEDK